MIQEVGFHVIDATGSIEEQQRQMRDIVTRGARRKPAQRPVAARVPGRHRCCPISPSNSIASRWPASIRGGAARQADRHRGAGLGGTIHAGVAAAHMAGAPGPRGAGHRAGARRAGRQGHPAGQRRQHAGTGDHDAVLRHRFRRSPGERDHSRVARRLRGADRPLYFFFDGARHRPRRGSRVDRTGGRLRAGAACGLLSARGRSRPADARGAGPRALSTIGKAAWICASARTCTTASSAIRRA